MIAGSAEPGGTGRSSERWRLGQVARLIEAEIDVALLIAALEFPGLHAGAHHRDLVGRFIGVIAAWLQRLFPDADAADRHKDGGQLAFIGFCFSGGDGFAARIRRHHLLLAGGRLVRVQIAEMHRVDDVGFDDADKAFGDIHGVIDAEVPEIGVEPVISRRQDRRLRSSLAAMGEKVIGVEHIQLMPGGKRIGQKLIGPQWRPVLGVQKAVFTRRDGNDLLVFDLIDDIDEKPRMPAGGEDLGLRTLFSIRRDDVLARQRGGPVNFVEDGDFIGFDVNVRCCGQTDQRDHHEDDAQRERQRSEIRPGPIDKEAEDARRHRREYEIQKCYDYPEHKNLPDRLFSGYVSSTPVPRCRGRKPRSPLGLPPLDIGSGPCCRS